jgi:putative transposase
MTSTNTTNTEPTTMTEPKRRPIRRELLDELLAGYKSPEDLIGKGGLLKELTRALVNRAMQAEMTEHLGYAHGQAPPEGQTNRRNGTRSKHLRSDEGTLDVEVPRDRDGTFEPVLVPKHAREFRGFDDKIILMYARGMTVRDIQAHLTDLYGVDVSRDLITRVTDEVVEELRAWQQRPLEEVYPIVYIDALVVKIRHKGVVANRAIHVVVGLRIDGRKEVLGMWIAAAEGAKFWLSILTELKQRGVRDILVLCADGLKGLPEAVEASFPETIFQTCVVHLIRSSMRYVAWGERRALCAELRKLYTAQDEEAAMVAFERFEATYGDKYPTVVKAWRDRWDEWTPFLAFPQEIRRIIYTTNAIEALHRQLRKVLKTRGHLPSDDAALKLLFLAVRNAESSWGGRTRTWSKALMQFAIHFEGRLPQL